MKLTVVFEPIPEGYIGYVLELRGANSQGVTLAETKRNLREAILLVSSQNRRLNRPRNRARVVSELWNDVS